MAARKRKKKSLKSSSGEKESTFFSAAAELMRGRGVRDIRKIRFRLDPGDTPVVVTSNPECLSAEPLAEPEFWIPEGHDGEGWKREICAPPWFDEERAREWTQRWRHTFQWPHQGEINDNSESFVDGELAALRALSSSPDEHPSAAAIAGIGRGYLERAMVDAYGLGGGFPPRELRSLSDGEILPLSDGMARVIELAFRAGHCSARSSAEYRDIPLIVRKGKNFSDRVGKGRPKRKFEDLSEWEKRAVEILREHPQQKRGALIDQLQAEGFATPKEDKWKLRGRRSAMTPSSFETTVSRLAKAYVSVG